MPTDGLSEVLHLFQIIGEANQEDRLEKNTWWRALCFGKPIGPWRTDRKLAQEDLIDRELGSYDEWGKFWVTVPGDMQIKREVPQSIAA